MSPSPKNSTNLDNLPFSSNGQQAETRAASTLAQGIATLSHDVAMPARVHEQTFTVGTHPALYVPKHPDKKVRRKAKDAMCAKASKNIVNVEMTLTAFADHLGNEHGVMSEIRGQERNNDNAFASFLPLDDDQIEDSFPAAIADFHARTDYSLVWGGTPSPGHHRALVPFVGGSIHDPVIYKLASQWLSRQVGVETDPASNVLSQPWIGFRKDTQTTLTGKLLTVDDIMAAIAPDLERLEHEKAEREAQHAAREYKPIDAGSDYARARVAGVVNSIVRDCATLKEGTNRKKFVLGRMRWGATFLAYYPLTRAELEKAGVDGCAANGALAQYGLEGSSGVMDAIKRGIDAGLNDPPEPLEAPTRRPARSESPVTPTSQPSAAADQSSADVILNQRYLDKLPDAPVIALASDIGTGKTTLSIGASDKAEKVVFLLPRKRLAENISHAAQRRGAATIEDYQGLSKADRRRPARMAICTPSYSALAEEAPGLPIGEHLFLDEFPEHLEFIYGDNGSIFEGRGAVDAAESVKYAIRNFKQVWAISAHTDQLSIDYLRAQGREVLHVVNEYAPQRGALTIYAKRERALAQGEALVLANEGVVAYAVASEQRAKVIAESLADLLGDSSAVLLLTAETIGERQAAFFADPDRQIGQYRAIVYSPVLDMGFDITHRVRAVIGIMAAHLTAYGARQMIGRCRNAQESHVYLPATSGQLEESAEQIEANELAKAARDIKRLNAKGVRVSVEIDSDQRDYLYWHARIMARRNQSINHLREHFTRLCKGYTITFCENQAPELKAKLEAIKQALDDARKALVLTVDPIDAATFRNLRDAGKADEKVIVAHLRGKIESVTGATISDQLRDQLWTADQRAHVRRFTDLIDQIAELRSADAQDIIDGIPLPKRRYRTTRRNVINAVLRALIDSDGGLLQLSKADLETALAPVIERYDRDLTLLFGWRRDRCKSAAATARHVLKTIGLKLDSDQQTVNRAKLRTYQIDAVTFAQIRTLAGQRLAMLERKRAEQYEAAPNLKTAIDTVSQGDGSFKIAESLGGSILELPKKSREWGGASRYNPFSKPSAIVEVYP